MPKVRRIFTIGHSNRSIEEFISILKVFGINAIVDVRRFPTSKYEHFKREKLKRFLEEHGIEYFYLGDKLGGFRTGGYKKFMETDTFCIGIEELEKIAEKKVVAVMCAERFPWKCHRKYISIALEERGWDIVHIIDRERTWKPKRAKNVEIT